MLQTRILEAMSERPVSAALIRARFPVIESDARAERILAHMAEEGAVVLMRRGGRNFYRLPPTALPEPEPSTRTRGRSYRPRGVIGEEIVGALRKLVKASTEEIGTVVIGKAAMTDPVQRKMICQRTRLHLVHMIKRGAAGRTSRKPYRYFLRGAA